RHLAKAQDRVAAPLAAGDGAGARIDAHLLLQRPARRLHDVAVDLVLHARRVDQQAGIVSDDDPAAVDGTGHAVDLDVGDPGRPGRAEARKPAVDVARVGEALAAQQLAVGRLLLRLPVLEPAGALGRRFDQVDGAWIVE